MQELQTLNLDTLGSAAGDSVPSTLVNIAEQASQSGSFESMAPPLQIALFLGAMVMLSGALVSITAFTRIVIVLSFVRKALSTQEIPPTQVIIGLSLFLTLFVMAPTFHAMHEKAISKYMNQQMSAGETFEVCKEEMLDFMRSHLRSNSGISALNLFLEVSKTGEIDQYEDAPVHVVIPAFIIHELKLAFIMGFCIYIPFLLIDLVVSTVLMSLGMMMMPPVVISTPCKLMLFVLVDGWTLIIKTITASFGA
ncbi:flagellar type III secretion system pore protein FliP [Pirellulaceae bacterium]|jgi:flagellar biosynthesis protein FliP|nr:flagellar type III secretion system pore protein FliP [Mariniblastus sp.]MDB4756290.1 flagellar type III secretion system pore protein FliP [Mariniblastus sp.]MDB4794545.1 flagellar type III secretion system pore protein FliP [Pirellulaceae bacterium]